MGKQRREGRADSKEGSVQSPYETNYLTTKLKNNSTDHRIHVRGKKGGVGVGGLTGNCGRGMWEQRGIWGVNQN